MMSTKKPLRIAFITNNYTPYRGGVVSSIRSWAHELERAGHQVMIITLDFLGNKHHDEPHVVRVYCPIKFTYKTNRMAIPWRADEQVLTLLKDYKPDIVHSHHPFLLGICARTAARMVGVPLVFTYHTIYEEYAHYVPLPSRLTRPCIAALAFSYCRSVATIIAPSAAIKEHLMRNKIATPMAVIPSPLQTIFTQHGQIDRPLQQPVHLITIGRFVPEKNLYALLDVIAALEQDKYVCTLAGYGYAFEQTQEYAYNVLKLSPERVRFIHKPSQEEIARLYREADLFLFSSRVDTQGLVLAEAMASGTPVVAFDGPGQRSIIEQGDNGFLAASQEEMVQLIQKISAHPELYAHLRSGAYKTACRYHAPVLLESLLMTYQETIARHQRGHAV